MGQEIKEIVRMRKDDQVRPIILKCARYNPTKRVLKNKKEVKWKKGQDKKKLNKDPNGGF